jgi:hypothetical protein
MDKGIKYGPRPSARENIVGHKPGQLGRAALWEQQARAPRMPWSRDAFGLSAKCYPRSCRLLSQFYVIIFSIETL